MDYKYLLSLTILRIPLWAIVSVGATITICGAVLYLTPEAKNAQPEYEEAVIEYSPSPTAKPPSSQKGNFNKTITDHMDLVNSLDYKNYVVKSFSLLFTSKQKKWAFVIADKNNNLFDYKKIIADDKGRYEIFTYPQAAGTISPDENKFKDFDLSTQWINSAVKKIKELTIWPLGSTIKIYLDSPSQKTHVMIPYWGQENKKEIKIKKAIYWDGVLKEIKDDKISREDFFAVERF